MEIFGVFLQVIIVLWFLICLKWLARDICRLKDICSLRDKDKDKDKDKKTNEHNYYN